MTEPLDGPERRSPWNVPNAITILRFPLAVLFAVLDGPVLRALVVAVAAFSDLIDGRLARARRQDTRLGALLDPVADKTFMASALITLYAEARIPWWTLPLLLVRDIGVVLGAGLLALRGQRVRVRARRPGKIVTWLQFAAVAALLLYPRAAIIAAAACAAAGTWALLDYGRAAAGELRATG